MKITLFSTHIFHCSIVIKCKRSRGTGHVARMEEDRSALIILTGKHIGKKLLGRPRSRWKDNMRMNLREICVSPRHWIGCALDLNLKDHNGRGLPITGLELVTEGKNMVRSNDQEHSALLSYHWYNVSK